MAREPDPQVQRLLSDLDEQGSPPTHSLSVEGARRLLRDQLEDDPDLTAVGAVHDVSIPGEGGDLPLRVYVPEGAGPFPVLVYVHGGGWVRASIETHDESCRDVTDRVGCITVSVGYRRAPEHPFPAAVEDVYAATKWVGEHVPALNGDPDRIAVAGASAGGNLAAATALAVRDLGGPNLVRQVLMYPALDSALDTDSMAEYAEGYYLTRRSMEWYWGHYLDREMDGRHPYASPLAARDLAGVAPATVLTCGFDPLQDEGQAYVDRLHEADVEVSHHHYPGMIHSFLLFPRLDRAGAARETVAEELRRAFDL